MTADNGDAGGEVAPGAQVLASIHVDLLAGGQCAVGLALDTLPHGYLMLGCALEEILRASLEERPLKKTGRIIPLRQ